MVQTKRIATVLSESILFLRLTFLRLFLRSRMQLMVTVVLVIAVFVPAFLIQTLPSSADPVASTTGGAQLFTIHCAGCHPNGGNIVRRGKTLKMKALKRRHVDSVEAIATLTTNGKGLMSAYGERLTPAEITVISNYVWQQAQQNWQQR